MVAKTETGLAPKVGRLDHDPRRLAIHCARFLDEHKLEDIAVFEVGPWLAITDYFVIATGRSSRHLRAASDRLLQELRDNGVVRRGIEGYKDDKWVLVDLADAVVHLFGEEARRHYDLELLGDRPRVDWRSGIDAIGRDPDPSSALDARGEAPASAEA